MDSGWLIFFNQFWLYSFYIFSLFSGKVVTIRNGKNQTEKILLLRNDSGTGPVLSAILYDVDNQLCKIIPGNTIKCCLRFSTSQFYVLKIMKAGTGSEGLCNRLQNICNLLMTDWTGIYVFIIFILLLPYTRTKRV